MLKPILVIFFSIIAFAIFFKTLYTLFSLLRKGKPHREIPSFWQAFKDLIIMVMAQKKVFRWPYAGFFHIMIFWGFLVLTTTIVEMYGEAFSHTFVFPIIGGTTYLAFCQDLFIVLVLIGVVMAACLRLIGKPKRFEGSDHVDAFVILGLISTIMITLLIMHAYRVTQNEFSYYTQGFFASRQVASLIPHHLLPMLSEVSYWLHLGCILFFLTWLPRGKHLHLVSIIPNVLLRKHSNRGKLSTMDLNDETIVSFGANKWDDFKWKDLLDTFACMECGRCTEVCPANSTGKELNPKKLHTGIRYAVQKNASKLLSGKEEFPAILENTFSDDFFWQCTTCAACVEECPATNEHIDKIIEVRRYMALSEGKVRPEARQTLKSLETQYNPFSLSHADRFAWTKGLNVTFIEDNPKAEYIYWVGCFGCFDQRNQKVTQAFIKILQKAGVSFALLREERCTGDTARRLGNEDLYQSLATKNIETLSKYPGKTIITQCPHCFNTIQNEYPDLGGKFTVIHHTQFLEKLIQEKKITLTQEIKQRLVYHDSCYLGRHNNIYAAPRNVLKKVPGIHFLEMPKSHSKSFCCGGGGGRMVMEETEGKRVNVERIEQAASTHPDAIISNCPFCLSMFEDGIKTSGMTEKMSSKDLAEIIAESME